MRKRAKLSLSSSSSPSTEDLVEESEEVMVFPSENSRPSSKNSNLLKPCFTTSIDGSEAVLPHKNRSASSPDLKALSFSVSFNEWRFANTSFKSWATKMAALHKPTWRKAGIFDAVMASTHNIRKDADLILGIAEKWCPDTKCFVFPWGETTITLEDVMVLLGFSVLGSPVFATLDSSGEKIKEKLEKEWQKIKKDKKAQFVTQVLWMVRFMDSGDELEHVAFLALWLSYFVFPSRFYHIYEAIFPIAVHLSTGTQIALAPAVLAHLYAELSLLKNHIRAFTKSKFTKIDLSALFKLVQVWTWERFRELQPTPNPLRKGDSRLARWLDLKQRTSDVRQILDNSKIESFEWRPYTKTVKEWEFPKFYPEKALWVPVGPNLDDDFISFARCIKVSELVGIDCVEHYFPNRVASQFGMLQDVLCPVNGNSLSQEAAWTQYNKPIEYMTLFIPSRSAIPRVTPMFCEWWRKKCAVESAETLSSRTVIVHDTSNFVPWGSKMSRTSGVGNKIAEDLTNKKRKCMKLARANRRKYTNRVREDGSKMKRTSEDGTKIAKDSEKKRRQYMKRARGKRRNYLKQARDKTRKYMKRVRENDKSTMGCCQSQVPSVNDDEDLSLTIAQIMRLEKNKNNGGDASEPLGKKSRLELDNNDSGPRENLASIRADGDETVPPPNIEQRNEETGEIGSKAGKNMVLSPIYENNSSDPPFGFDEAINIRVSPPETRQTVDDELDVYGSNVEKMTMTHDGSKEFQFHEDGAMAGEKASSDGKEDDVVDNDDSLIQTKLALNANNNEATPRQKLASGGPDGDETPDESNIHIDVGNGTQGSDCLLTALGSEEPTKSNEQLENLEKRNEGVDEGDVGNDSFEKSLHNLKVLASSMEERIINTQRNVAWLKERRAIKQRKIAATRLI